MFKPRIQRRHWLGCAIATGMTLMAGLHNSPAWALDAPQGRVILTVSGQIGQTNRDGKAVFDLAMLQKLPQHTFTTQTPWEPKPVKFSGPLLKDVLDAVGATGKKLKMVALNDYAVEVPVSDVAKYRPVLARKINGKVLGIRDKGPLFLMYPFDDFPEIRNDVYYARCIWQLNRINVM